MGIFGKSLAGMIFDAITDSKSSGSSRGSSGSSSSSSWKPYIPTTTTTMPNIGLGSRSGGIMDTLEKIDTILTDVDTEGEKRGYERAAAEYDAAYERIENEYLAAKKMLNQQMVNKDAEATRLISKLQQLEEEKKILERQVREKTKQVSNKYDIPVSSVSQSLASGTLLMGGTGTGVLDLIYRYKSKKLKEAEEKGYAEARKLYRKKIRELKDNLELLKKKGDAELQELASLITDAIKEISDAETKIAELEIALNS